MEARLGPGPFLSQNLETIRQFILEHHTFLPREQAEYDNTVRQIIPYVILRRGRHYFLLRRLKKRRRPASMKSFPWGWAATSTPRRKPRRPHRPPGLWRELSEEVTLSQITSLTCVGLINETTGGVSDYHTALVYLLETTGEVTVRETEKMSGSWASPQELSAVFDRLETWSQIVLEEVISPNTV